MCQSTKIFANAESSETGLFEMNEFLHFEIRIFVSLLSSFEQKVYLIQVSMIIDSHGGKIFVNESKWTERIRGK